MSSTRGKKPWLQQPNLPVTYPKLFLELAAERGVEPALVLEQAGLPQSLLADPVGRVTPEQFVALVGVVLALVGDDGLGLEVGLRQPLTAHGNMGLAMMCSATVGDAAQVMRRFWHLRGRGLDLAYSEQGDRVIFDFHQNIPMTGEVRRVLMDSVLASFHRGLSFALGGDEADPEICFDYTEPAYIGRFRERLPPLRYDMPFNQYRGARHMLSRPLATASPETLGMAIALCERESALVDGDQDHIVIAARAAMVLGPNGYPDPQQLADQLHMTPRTLRRRLQAQGCNYRELCEDARRRDALQLLENPALDIQDIAALLGYTDPANFTRAFRLWTGKAPSHYRTMRSLSDMA